MASVGAGWLYGMQHNVVCGSVGLLVERCWHLDNLIVLVVMGGQADGPVDSG